MLLNMPCSASFNLKENVEMTLLKTDSSISLIMETLFLGREKSNTSPEALRRVQSSRDGSLSMSLKLGKGDKLAVAPINIVTGKRVEPAQAEVFNHERSHDTAVYNCLA